MLTLIFMQLSRLISCCKIHNNLQSGDLEIIEFKPLLHRTGQVHRVDRSWWVMFGSSFTAAQQQPTVHCHRAQCCYNYQFPPHNHSHWSPLRCTQSTVSMQSGVLSRFTAPGKVGLAKYSPAQAAAADGMDQNYYLLIS